MAKNLILWLIIAAVLVVVMNNFTGSKEGQTLNYSDFIHQVQTGNIQKVVVDGFTITGTKCILVKRLTRSLNNHIHIQK